MGRPRTLVYEYPESSGEKMISGLKINGGLKLRSSLNTHGWFSLALSGLSIQPPHARTGKETGFLGHWTLHNHGINHGRMYAA